MIPVAEAWTILGSAERVLDEAQIAAALDRLAGEITARLRDECPIVLSVMGGGVVFAGQLITRLRFPLELDYVHATRYGDLTRGGRLEWKVFPRADVAGRTVLALDDILDEGQTLVAIRDRLLDAGASRVLTAVFCEKELGREKPIRADFVGLRVPDRYVFGFGMDVRGAWRNLPEVYALPA